MNDPLMVAIGAVPGAWLRYRVVNHLAPMVPRRHWGTFGVNVIACFTLGLIVSLVDQSCAPATQGPNRILLLVGTGFLGSLSTFSTFAAEVLATLRQGHWKELTLLTAGSVLVGLMAMVAGLTLGT
jgi:CrcB protein